MSALAASHRQATQKAPTRVYQVGVDRVGGYVLTGFVGKDHTSEYQYWTCQGCHKTRRVSRGGTATLKKHVCQGGALP